MRAVLFSITRRFFLTMDEIRGGDYRGDGGDASPKKILVGGTQMQASPQQLPLLAMSSPHCLEEIAATDRQNTKTVLHIQQINLIV